MSKKGLFITFEGTDGVGKSTQIRLLKSKLDEKGIEVVLTREPGGTDISEKIRDIILSKDNSEISYMTEAMLYAASRAQLVAQIIKPALEQGKTVISDRFIDSSIVYQGYGRKLGNAVYEINKYAVGDCMPDVTFLLKLDPDTGIKRASGEEPDRIESEDISYHRSVYQAYEKLEEEYPDRIIGIDATGSPKAVNESIMKRIDRLLG